MADLTYEERKALRGAECQLDFNSWDTSTIQGEEDTVYLTHIDTNMEFSYSMEAFKSALEKIGVETVEAIIKEEDIRNGPEN